jgi:hypothetical protein
VEGITHFIPCYFLQRAFLSSQHWTDHPSFKPLSICLKYPEGTNVLQTMDWCYIFYALNYQLAAILMATTPRWYLYQALGSNLLWMLP